MFDDAYNTDRDQQLAAFISAGQFPQALDLLESWYAGEPWNGEVLMRMAVVHWLAGEPAHTLRDLDAYLLMDPENAEALAAHRPYSCSESARTRKPRWPKPRRSTR